MLRYIPLLRTVGSLCRVVPLPQPSSQSLVVRRCMSSSTTTNPSTTPPPPPPTTTDRILRWFRCHPDQIRVSAENTTSFPRYRLLPFAMVNHLCLGSILAWSMFNVPLTRLDGVVAPAAHDWMLGDIGVTFSLVMGGFVWGSILSSRLQVWGPRACGLMGAAALGTGFCAASAAIATQSLPLLYFGGLIWGMSNGLSYVPPVAMLLQWFPDRKGFASGACLVGFGAGALLATPLISALLRTFRVAPEYLGPLSLPSMVDASGRVFVAGREAVVATVGQLSAGAWPGLEEGFYAVGSGSTGAMETFAALGAFYCSAMAVSALQHRLPHACITQKFAPSTDASSSTSLTTLSVLPSVAMRTPQFAILWTSFGCAIAGSYGIISAGSTLFTDTTGVSAATAASLVAAMSAFNLGGRLFWSNLSDALARRQSDPFLGRRFTFSLMWGMTPWLYAIIAASVHAQPSTIATGATALAVCGIMSAFGGAAATWPALCGDLWGTKHVGIIAARQLSVVLPAAYLGPKLVAWMRERGLTKAIHDLTALVTDADFERAFGASKDALEVLIHAKTVTVTRLMELVPIGTLDPTLHVYDEMLYVMAGLQAVAFIGMRMLKPVDPVYHERERKEIMGIKE